MKEKLEETNEIGGEEKDQIKVEYNNKPQIQGDLLQLNSLHYIAKIKEAIDIFRDAESGEEKKEAISNLRNIVKEFEDLKDSGLDLSQSQIAGIYNNIGVLLELINPEEAKNSFMLAFKTADMEDINDDNQIKILELFSKNLSRVHEVLDKASWAVIKDKWFIEDKDSENEDKDYFLNLKELKVDEIDSLKFNNKEYQLLRRLCLKDDYSLEHSIRVMAISLRMVLYLESTQDIKISNEGKKIFAKAVALHDIGKASKDDNGEDLIPDYILKAYRQGKLTKEEFEIMKKHVDYSARDLNKIYDQDDDIAQRMINIILRHHRRSDGSGYPKTRDNGEVIDFDPEKNKDHFFVEIMSFADTIEAMTSREREYEETFTLEEARQRFMEEITNKEGEKIKPLKEIYSERMKNVFSNEDFWENIRKEFLETNKATKKIEEEVKNRNKKI